MKFQKGTSAERVVAGILAVNHRLERQSAPRVGEPVTDSGVLDGLVPYVPHPALEGGFLDLKLAQPPPPELAPPDPVTGSVARGDDLIQGV